jgi:hypothetical protein
MDKDGDGFTELDDYLQWMAAPHFMITPDANVDVDLGQMFFGYSGNATYWSSNVDGGTASVMGQMATFKPSRCGFVSWRVGVTDSAGGWSSKDIVAFVSNGSPSCP